MNQLTLFDKKVTPIITLRDYQLTAKKALYEKVRQGSNRIMVNAPCGWGKCYFAASIAHDASIAKGKRVLFVVPFRTLVMQAIESFKNFGLTPGVIAGEFSESRDELVQIATIQTLAIRKIDWFNYDILILDECHILAFSTWFKDRYAPLEQGKEMLDAFSLRAELALLSYHIDFHEVPTWEEIKAKWSQIKFDADDITRNSYKKIQKYRQLLKNPKASNKQIIIGLTGSPFRLSKLEGMQDAFSDVVQAETPKQMIKLGKLSPCVYYEVKGIDTSEVGTVRGDFDQAQLEVACTGSESIKSIVDNYKKLAGDRTFICFPVTVKHAELLLAEFTRQGEIAHIVTGDTPDKERLALFDLLRFKKIKGLISVGCLGVGFDVPNISCVLSCRPTKSYALYIQQIGRGMRTAPGKENCLVLDQAGNLRRFNMVESLVYPKLEDEPLESAPPPVKICEECNRINYAFAVKCESCGTPFPETGPKEKEEAAGEMKLYIPPEHQEFYKAYRQLLKKAYWKLRMPEWAYMQMVEKHDFKSIPGEWARHAIFTVNKNTTEATIKRYYQEYLQYVLKVAEARSQSMFIQQVNKKPRRNLNRAWVNKWFKNEFGVELNYEILVYCLGESAIASGKYSGILKQ